MSGDAALAFVVQVGLAPGLDSRDRDAVARGLAEAGRTLEGVVASHAGVHLDLSVGGLDLTWDLRARDEDAARRVEMRLAQEGGLAELAPDLASRVETLEVGRPRILASDLRRPGLVGIKRSLWLRVEPSAPPEAVARFEQETPLLADAIPAIRNWRWSRLAARGEGPGAIRWTHLWEQEFEHVDGLQIDYMSSPAHWGYIDRWFDPEMPERIVDLWLAHTACPESAPVLSWGAAGRAA